MAAYAKHHPLGKSTITQLRSQEFEPQILPANIEAEQALLGAIFVNNAAYRVVSDFLRDEHFHSQMHGGVYRICGQLIEAGDEANPVTLRAIVEGDPELQAAGGFGYLARLAASAVTIINAPTYARIIRDLALRRDGIAAAEKLIGDLTAVDPDRPATTILAEHDDQMFDMRAAASPRRPDVSLAQAIDVAMDQTEAAYKRGGGLAGLTTGLTDLDSKLGGLTPGDLIVVAGATSSGKTALALNICETLGRRGIPTGIFELEQSAAQLAQRILARDSGIPVPQQRRGELDMLEWDALMGARTKAGGMPIYLDDTPGISMPNLRQRARIWKQRYGIQALVVDHLQLMRSGSETTNRSQEISSYTGSMKVLAKELDIPIILLSQLRRGIESRENKRPMLADMRESGSIEQDADVVIFLYREEYYLANAEPIRRDGEDVGKFNDRTAEWEDRKAKAAGLAEAIIAKQRQGPLGTVKLAWNAQQTAFSDYAGPDYLPAQNY